MKLNKPLTLAVAVVAICFTSLDVMAGCFYPKRRTYTYWGYHYLDGSSSCEVVIGPQPPLEVVGEKTIECDGTVTQWGRVNCPDPDVTVEACEPICDFAASEAAEQSEEASDAKECAAER